MPRRSVPHTGSIREKIAFDRLEEIYRHTETPLALHGGTGLPEDIIQRCVELGCAKVNISTQLKHAFVDAFTEYRRDHPTDYEPLKIMAAQFESIKAVAADKIQQFGGAGRGLAEESGS